MQTLRVRNPGDKPVLVVEGEHFIGGKQNRALNATVLVPAKADLEIPVSCLERGRWGRRQAYRRDEAFAPNRVRAAQQAGVARSMGQRGSREGDQSAVWREVDEMLHGAEVESSTDAAAATRVLELARRFASAPGKEAPGVGVGVERRVADKRLLGQALTLDGAVVHAAFFTEDPIREV